MDVTEKELHRLATFLCDDAGDSHCDRLVVREKQAIGDALAAI